MVYSTTMSPFTLTKAINIAAPIAASQRGLSSDLPLIGSKKTREFPLPFPDHTLMTPVSRDNKTSGGRVLNVGSVELPTADAMGPAPPL